jgi:sulfite oxidase
MLNLTRRLFLRGAGQVAAGSALGSWLACGAKHANPGTGGQDAVGPTSSACPPFLTTVDEFYRQTGGHDTVRDWTMPELDESFELTVTGLVGQELRLSLSDLEADSSEHLSVVKTMVCVAGYHSTGIFTGVPLRVLLDRAGIDRERAARVRFFGADGFENNLRVADIYQAPDDLFEPLIAFKLYGTPLPVDLGYPFRLLLADRYGFKNIKWLARIEVTEVDEATGQYQKVGYPDAGVIEPMLTVETLRLEETVAAGPIELCGFAFSGYAGITAVELAIDGSGFKQARLSSLQQLQKTEPQLMASLQLQDRARFPPPLRAVWQPWQFTFNAKPGAHEVRIRARDTSGRTTDDSTLHITAKA